MYNGNKILERLIFDTMDLIERKTKILVNDIPELGEIEERWHEGRVGDAFMLNSLQKYLDNLNEK